MEQTITLTQAQLARKITDLLMTGCDITSMGEYDVYTLAKAAQKRAREDTFTGTELSHLMFLRWLYDTGKIQYRS